MPAQKKQVRGGSANKIFKLRQTFCMKKLVCFLVALTAALSACSFAGCKTTDAPSENGKIITYPSRGDELPPDCEKGDCPDEDCPDNGCPDDENGCHDDGCPDKDCPDGKDGDAREDKGKSFIPKRPDSKFGGKNSDRRHGNGRHERPRRPEKPIIPEPPTPVPKPEN